MISTLSPAAAHARRPDAAIARAQSTPTSAAGGATTTTDADVGRISTANNRPLYRLSAEQLFARLDRDAKGYLAAADFVRISPAGAQAAEAAHAERNARAREVFERIDADGDGQVSQNEFRTAIEAFIAPHGHGKALGIARHATSPASAPLAPATAVGDPVATTAVQAYASVAAAV